MTLTRRVANTAGVIAVAGLMAVAFIFQYYVKLNPCNMCMLQRGATILLGAAFLVAALHDAGRFMARVYGLLILIAAAVLVALSARHVWMQMQPLGSLASCGADFWTMVDMLPLHEVVSRIVNGGGDCQEIGWSLFGISIPGWLGIAGTALGLGGLWANVALPRSGGRA
jgi:protein dithiol:quinone oxidoreductase